MLIAYLLKVSLLLIVLTLGYRWLLRFETFSGTNRTLLWLNVLAAWTLPLLPIANWGPESVQTEFHQKIPVVLKTVSEVRYQVGSQIVPPQNIPSQSLGATDWITFAYFLVAVLLAARLLYQIGGLMYRLGRLPVQRLDNGILLIIDEACVSPYSFFNRIVCNPDGHSEQEMRHIMAHETEHVLRHHSFDLMLAEIQKTLLWINPAAWFHRNLVQENLEYLADRSVLENGFYRKEYQFSLLRSALQTNQLPVTNSFAQSLLKKRIKMMNRKPSGSWVIGKYILFISLIYVSSAFVAPYRERMTSFVPSVVKPVADKLTKSKTNIAEDPNARQKASVESAPSAKVRTSKWVLVKDGTLYWAISPLATWEDINAIKQELKTFGGDLSVNSVVYDPLQSFITSMTVEVKKKGSKGRGYQKEDRYTPMRSLSGYLGESGLGMGHTPPEPLQKALERDYQTALLLKKAHETDYFEDKLTEGFAEKKLNHKSAWYPATSLAGPDSEKILQDQGIGRSGTNLKISEMNKEAECYLNTGLSSFEELNNLSFEKVVRVSILEDSEKKRYIIVYTK
jgi:beta-lactamase regulating signal transducer with metallopeptidase domain